MAEPLPTRKRGQLPEDFWEEVLKRRAAVKQRRADEERERSMMEFVRCERCHWFKYCDGGFWKGERRDCPVLHSHKCDFFDILRMGKTADDELGFVDE